MSTSLEIRVACQAVVRQGSTSPLETTFSLFQTSKLKGEPSFITRAFRNGVVSVVGCRTAMYSVPDWGHKLERGEATDWRRSKFDEEKNPGLFRRSIEIEICSIAHGKRGGEWSYDVSH